jgi:hypothetical protein
VSSARALLRWQLQLADGLLDAAIAPARLRAYAAAVHAATDAYLAALPDDAMEPVPECLLTALLLTSATRRGEIACLLADPSEAW